MIIAVKSKNGIHVLGRIPVNLFVKVAVRVWCRYLGADTLVLLLLGSPASHQNVVPRSTEQAKNGAMYLGAFLWTFFVEVAVRVCAESSCGAGT